MKFLFCGDICPTTDTAETLAKLGVSYCAIANNHVFNHGKAGIATNEK